MGKFSVEWKLKALVSIGRIVMKGWDRVVEYCVEIPTEILCIYSRWRSFYMYKVESNCFMFM